MSESSEFISLDSTVMPEGVTLSIQHCLEQEIFPSEENYSVSQMYYPYFNYTFKYKNGRIIRAKAYLDTLDEITIFGCYDADGDAAQYEECRDWLETKDTILNLAAFDFAEIRLMRSIAFRFKNVSGNNYGIDLKMITQKKQAIHQALNLRRATNAN